jgi:hypothetical protein
MSFWTDLNIFGMSGSQIYHNFHGGTGDDGKGIAEASIKVLLVEQRYGQRTTSITELTTKMEGAWQGNAAGAAQRGSGPLAVEHGLAQNGMITANETLNSQTTAFHSAKGKVTQIPPTPEEPGLWDNMTTLGGAGRNYETEMNRVNSANDNNVAIMEEYETTSSSNASAMPTSYGRITDDYSAVGVQPPSPPPPNNPYNPYIPGTSNPNGRNPGTSGTPTNPSGNNPTNPGGRPNTPGNPSGNPPGTGTDPSGNRPPVGLPPGGRLPGGRPPGGGLPGENPALPGMLPPGGYGPTGGGGGSGSGFGPRGSGGGFGPGGSGGSGTGGPGTGGRGAGGFGPGAGGAAAAEAAAARGAGGPGGPGGRGGMGPMGGMGGGGKGGQGEDDTEHERPSFLVEPDPHETFGTDEVTAPPVIGE